MHGNEQLKIKVQIESTILNVSVLIIGSIQEASRKGKSEIRNQFYNRHGPCLHTPENNLLPICSAVYLRF